MQQISQLIIKYLAFFSFMINSTRLMITLTSIHLQQRFMIHRFSVFEHKDTKLIEYFSGSWRPFFNNAGNHLFFGASAPRSLTLVRSEICDRLLSTWRALRNKRNRCRINYPVSVVCLVCTAISIHRRKRPRRTCSEYIKLTGGFIVQWGVRD